MVTTRLAGALLLAAAAVAGPALAGIQSQGIQSQGTALQGLSVDGKKEVLVTFDTAGATQGNRPVANVRVERGGLVGEVPYPLVASPGLGACSGVVTGVERDCGWKLAAAGTCTPNAQVSIGAGAGCRLGDSSGDQMLRVCSGAQRTCGHAGPERLAESDNTRCGGVAPKADFRCPASGRFLVMAGAHASDQPVQVNLAATGAALSKLHLSGTDFAGVALTGRVDTGAQLQLALPFRIGAVARENARKYEPKTLPESARGWTWLYALEVRLPSAAAFTPACLPDADNRRVAIPFEALWDRKGYRAVQAGKFTFGCTPGVIAKCSRWGYRPWAVTNRADPALLTRVHWACTRLARADYCGDGLPHTRDGTLVFEWDNLRPPIAPPPGRGDLSRMTFESGWSDCGAICISHLRWQKLKPVCAEQNACLFHVDGVRPVAGAAGQPVPNFCDTQAEAEAQAKRQNRELHLFDLSTKH